MPNCPPEEQLAGFVAGTCSDAEAESVRVHMAACDGCASWVAEADANEGILDSVRVMLVEEARSPRGHGPGPAWKARIDAQAEASSPQAIEGYEILEEIGRGGMGVVYKAVQASTKREVALKVLLEGPFASEKSKRRFEREVELAAQLQHPHIVTILESGIASGRYYFAMQYVDGQPLDAYLADRKLSIDDALRLFGKICDAITYAHQRGVIHRDLKPSNILVDKEGVPHVLDFGLAKVADPEEAAPTQLSITGEVMGTLPYISPEQATGSHQDIDVRTDVYSLGVILYEMLTGKYPYPVVGHVAEVLKNIAEAEPEKPSKIRRRINDEVETIVLKALAKEAERRYPGAGDLAKDVERYLAGEPIDAKRDSGWYVLRKTVRRYRVPVAVITVFLVLVTTSTIVVSVMYRAQSRLLEDVKRERNRAKEGELNTLYNAGTTFAALGELGEAEAAYRRAIELSPTHFSAWFNLGNVLRDAQNVEDAVSAYEAAIKLDPTDIRPVGNLAEMYRERGAFEQALPLIETVRSQNPTDVHWLGFEAEVLNRLGRWRDATTTYERLLELAPDDIPALNDLAWLYLTSPDPDARDKRGALELVRRLKRLAPDVPYYDNTVALAYVQNGLVDEAAKAAGRRIEETGDNPFDLIVLSMCDRARGDEDSAGARVKEARVFIHTLSHWERRDFDLLLALTENHHVP